MQNFFTGNNIGTAFSGLTYNQDVTVDRTQLPFYAPPTPANTDKTRPIAGCAPAPAPTDDATRSELQFLDTMGLLLRDPAGAVYIHPGADKAFYKSGLFAPDLRTKLSGKSATERNALLIEALRLVSEYTLPARIAWLEGIGVLSPSIYPQVQRAKEIEEMETLKTFILNLL